VLFDAVNIIMVYASGTGLYVAHVPNSSVDPVNQVVIQVATGAGLIKWVTAKLVDSNSRLVITYHDSGTGQLKMIGKVFLYSTQYKFDF